MWGCTHIYISQFDGLNYVILFWVRKDGLGTFDVSVARLYFYQCAFAFVSCNKIDFQPRILAEIIELTIHLTKNVGHQIFKDGSLVSIEIALQNISSLSLFEPLTKHWYGNR